MPRRLLDIALASFLLLLTAPIMLATTLAIRLESAGPAIYRQERVGLGRRIFTLWKFRSMRVDAERQGPIWASLRDSRVTLVGGLIRRVRIDELPQLVNILRRDEHRRATPGTAARQAQRRRCHRARRRLVNRLKTAALNVSYLLGHTINMKYREN